jgi:hypothetical protein
MRAWLRKLPERTLMVFIAHRVEGKSSAEIAAELGERIKEQDNTLGAIAEAPAIQLPPEAMGKRILRASEQMPAEDARLQGPRQYDNRQGARNST